MTHDCTKEEEIGRIKEFIEGMKGLKATLFTISLAVLLQVGTFLYLWGGLSNTVQYHDKTIEKILTKLDTIVSIAHAEVKK
jgi:hypothetical protein